MLPLTKKSVPQLSRRVTAILATVAVCAVAVPTVYLSRPQQALADAPEGEASQAVVVVQPVESTAATPEVTSVNVESNTTPSPSPAPQAAKPAAPVAKAPTIEPARQAPAATPTRVPAALPIVAPAHANTPAAKATPATAPVQSSAPARYALPVAAVPAAAAEGQRRVIIESATAAPSTITVAPQTPYVGPGPAAYTAPPTLVPAPTTYVPAPTTYALTPRPKGPPSLEFLPPLSPSEKKVVAALDGPTDLDFADTPLSDVVDYITEKHDIGILLDAKGLNSAGIDTSVPVTKSLKGIALRSALRMILGEIDATYLVRDDVLWITSQEVAMQTRVTRTYPVGDLRDDTVHDDKEQFEALSKAITGTIEPESWDAGGGNCSIAVVGPAKCLVISQTHANQDSVLELLRALREAKSLDDARPANPNNAVR